MYGTINALLHNDILVYFLLHYGRQIYFRLYQMLELNNAGDILIKYLTLKYRGVITICHSFYQIDHTRGENMADVQPKPEERDLQAQMETLWSSYADELTSKVSRIDELIGEKHWLSVGTYKESLICSLLKNKVPTQFQLGTGFLLSGVTTDDNKIAKCISKQLDVLIWNCSEHSPIFRVDDFVIAPPESCKGVIEVKGHITHEDLKSGIENLDSVARFGDLLGNQNSPFLSLFAFNISEDMIFPDTFFNTLWRYYTHDTKDCLDWRLNHDTTCWRRPWINQIIVLDRGVITLMQWNINGKTVPVYVALKTVTDEGNDSYAFMERELLMSLRVGDKVVLYPYLSPGAAPLMSKKLQYFGGRCFLPIPLGGGQINTLARVEPSGMDYWRSMQFTPRKPSEPRKDDREG